MPKAHNPRHGSMQFWPRKRARRAYTRIRSWPNSTEPKLLGFAGYKVGMVQVSYVDNTPNSMSKGEVITNPATVIECPPIKILAITFYNKTPYGLQTASQILAQNLDKNLKRKIIMPKNKHEVTDAKFEDLRLIVHTQPSLTATGKKKPEIFEIGLGGGYDEKLKFAKENLGKEIEIKDIMKEGQGIDIHAVSKGKGFQGPVKRFGVKIRHHKSEKTKRGPGSLGGWKGQGHTMYRIAHAGQTGFHTRTEYSKWLLKIGDKPEQINPKGGFTQYGMVKSNYILVRGSIAGARKRLVRFTNASRPHKLHNEAPEINVISK